MNVGILTVDIRIPLSQSLKAKRKVIKSLKERIRAKFNVSVAETDNHDLWQKSTLSIVQVAGDKRIIDSALSKINNFITNELNIDVLDYQIEVI